MDKNEKEELVVVDLFAGIGGLSCGFDPKEDPDEEHQHAIRQWFFEQDARIVEQLKKRFSFCPQQQHRCRCVTLSVDQVSSQMPEVCHVLLGGPPCQPFSRAGKQKGHEDSRNHLPTFSAAVRQSRPWIFVMENVEGLARPPHRQRVLDPFVASLSDQYAIQVEVIKFHCWGVPQKRTRLLVIGLRRDQLELHGPFSLKMNNTPKSTITVVGDVLDAQVVCRDDLHPERTIGPLWSARIAKYESTSHTRPRCLYFDEPSRTLTTRNLCGRTNDTLRIRRHDGSQRTLTVEEAARLQTVPLDWLEGLEENLAFSLIGNSVPPQFSKQTLVPSILEWIKSQKTK